MPKQAQLKKNNEDIFLNIYKIGDIYITTNSENPADRFGGTWELFGPGRCLVCVDTSQSEFNTVMKTGGEKSHGLTINEMPSHTHEQNPHGHYAVYTGDRNSPYKQFGGNYVPTGGFSDLDGRGWTNSGTMETTASNKNTGGGQSHNNLQPYITVYMWRRVG